MRDPAQIARMEVIAYGRRGRVESLREPPRIHRIARRGLAGKNRLRARPDAIERGTAAGGIGRFTDEG